MSQSQNTVIEVLKTLALSGVLAVGVRQFVAEARYIPSESMLPTLEIDDRLMIEKLTYRFREPKRGEIIVFIPPNEAILCNPQQSLPITDAYIKRIIGLPGDEIEIRDSLVYVNGKLLDEDYIHGSPLYEQDPTIVPADSYFVLGDNRNNSCDSHVWGFVPASNIIGRAALRFLPFNRIGNLPETVHFSEEQQGTIEN
ncbi:signal peptidase I [Spirulina subsalsa FACHB-351]|uniref:Signal peptidase I n=1 Tax=Spirulina subsalsa FACHB-351 TaxID=234711 RepID=A0ABT3L1A6_9CYAN|nr:signal peptidase I [Spirulina subsalsa]MCW6035237.1 signal peptidase I [Spirulina subsalsa FACHB-351]